MHRLALFCVLVCYGIQASRVVHESWVVPEIQVEEPGKWTSINEISKNCEGKPADIAILLDRSSGVSEEDFGREIKFAKRLVRFFHISKDGNWLSIALLDGDIHPKTKLGYSGSASQLEKTLDTLAAAASSSEGWFTKKRDIDSVLDYASWFWKRKSVAHIIILLTNEDVYTATDRLMGPYLYIVRVDDKPYKPTSRESSFPSRYVFRVKGEELIDSLIPVLDMERCRLCKPKHAVDLYFGVDHISLGSRNSKNILNFIENIWKRLETDGNTEKHVVLNECVTERKFFTSGTDVLSNEIVDNKLSFPDLGKLMTKIRLRSKWTWRKGNQKLIILFIDSSVQIGWSAILEAKRIEKAEIYVVAIGRDVDMKGIRNLASFPPDCYIFHVDSYEMLRYTVGRLVSRMSDFVD